MKLLIFLFSVLLISFLVFSCDSRLEAEEKPTVENDYVTIKPEQEFKMFKTIDFSSKIDSVQFIELEFGDESIITNVSRVEIFESKIYVLDTKTSLVFIFDIDGNFRFKINYIGEGPGEYAQLDYFDLDFENREIVLTDLMSYWIMRYDLSGNFISRQKIPFWCDAAISTHDKGVVLYANYRSNEDKLGQEYNLYFLDSVMGISKSYFPYSSSAYVNPRIRFATPSNGPFYTYNKQSNFYTPYGNMIYNIDKEGLVKKFKIDFGEKNFDNSLFDKPNELVAYMKEGEYNLLREIQETDNYLFFLFSRNKSVHAIYSFYDKRTKNSFSGTEVKVGDNTRLPGLIKGTFEDFFISIVQPSSIISWKENVNANNWKLNEGFAKIQYDFSEQLEAADNPVVMIFKLK